MNPALQHISRTYQPAKAPMFGRLSNIATSTCAMPQTRLDDCGEPNLVGGPSI